MLLRGIFLSLCLGVVLSSMPDPGHGTNDGGPNIENESGPATPRPNMRPLTEAPHHPGSLSSVYRWPPAKQNRNTTFEKLIQSTDTIMVIEPIGFEFNAETAADNLFSVKYNITNAESEKQALQEWHLFHDELTRRGVNLLHFKGQQGLPDAVYPDWVLTYYDAQTGERTLALCPMKAESRRKERLQTSIDQFKGHFKIADLTEHEAKNHFLEGKGSIVISRRLNIGFINLSERSSLQAAQDFARRAGINKLIQFTAYDIKDKSIYHTDVVMTIGTNFIVICEEAIPDKKEVANIRAALKPLNLEWVVITKLQMTQFCANIREIRIPVDKAGPFYRNHPNKDQLKTWENNYLVMAMSQRSFLAFTTSQRDQLKEGLTEIVSSPIYHIENVGGGSTRCITGEIYY